ncbi:hypothetical protein BV898_03372 [Hypsibius exemplaris]|uniref:Uncharacterized protein n=1 Tax=Hypsibius exemplaris TaxID=2072580 RepID=A0A1W0X4V5_HYPEX|nr:hypothetical protein BV898_03372 [Hypsibius exemplaris]
MSDKDKDDKKKGDKAHKPTASVEFKGDREEKLLDRVAVGRVYPKTPVKGNRTKLPAPVDAALSETSNRAPPAPRQPATTPQQADPHHKDTPKELKNPNVKKK